MDVQVTDGKLERGRHSGVRFKATCEKGSGEFIVSADALSDLARERNLAEDQLMDTFTDHADEIGEAAGIAIAQGRAAPPGQVYLIGSAELPGTR